MNNAHRSQNATMAIDSLRQLAERTQAFRIEAVEAEHTSGDRPRTYRWDYRVRLVPQSPGAPPVYFNIEAKARLNPQVAFESLNRFHGASSDGTPTVFCPVISPRVQDMCRAEGVSYYDADGNAHLAAPGFLLHVAGQSHRAKTKRTDDGADPFAFKSSRIVRVLLTSPGTRWHVQALAKEAQVSIGLASRIKDALLYQKHIEKAGGRFRLVRPRELLEKWAGRYSPPFQAVPLYLMGSSSEAENRAAQWCDNHQIRYALTQFSGAWRVAPMVRYQRSTIYVQLDPAVTLLEELIAGLGAKRVDSGANLSLWPTTDAAVFFGSRRIDHVQVASPIQLYLDLRGQTGRGQEAAEEVYEKEIRPTFDQPISGENAGV